ncbi:MAG TPA: PLP-dependent aminotransferase family protein [Candidatus Limiplasma sp.]|nr:PLP-dependent aminotransferase family protein [Candidatus Limiplasma sp.]
MLPKGVSYADRFDGITGSAIRAIFKVLARPGIISFAGGNPSADALPNEQCAELARDVLLSDGKRILQYGGTEGYPPFVESLQAYLAENYDFPVEKKNILPLSGSTQGVDLICKAFLNPGDVVLTEDPTFLGNMQTMRIYQQKLVPVESDDGGLRMDALEAAVNEYRPKMLYCIPTFQNPTGRTLPADRRERIAAMAEKYGFLVIEDDPYRDLRYDGQAQPSVKHFDKTGHVVYMGSFSKLVSPGMRVGYMVAQEEIIGKCTIGKQGTDLHTPLLTQAIIDQFLRRGLLLPHLQSILGPYRDKMHAMLDELKIFSAGTQYTTPEGGLFIFCTLPEGENATERFQQAVERGVAFVPGTYFYPNGGHDNTFRLNFSNSTPEQIKTGMGILRKLFEEK